MNLNEGMEGSSYKTIRWNRTGGIGTLILNDPPSNAMTTRFFTELAQWADSLRSNPLPEGLIIRGAGRHFSSGADLEDLLSAVGDTAGPGRTAGTKSQQYLLGNYRPFMMLEELSIPVMAVIRGVCIGSAFEMALHCHFRFCSEDSVFGLPESTFTLMPGLGGIRKIAGLAGPATAMERSLRGNTFGAREAMDLGLVDRILPKKELDLTAVSFILHAAKNYHRAKKPLYLKRYFTTHGPVSA